jgi:hypothetical protein
MLIGAAGSAVLIAGGGWGMYLVTMSYIVLLVHAWSIMIALRQKTA